MKRIIQVGALASAIVLGVAGNPIPVIAVGEEQTYLMIAEVSTEAIDGASKEHIHLFNPRKVAVNVSGWMVQYRSASYQSEDTKGWSNRAILGCQSTKVSDCSAPSEVIIKPGDVVKLSSHETGEGVLPLASGMAGAGGVVRLVQPGQEDPIVHDKVGYGSAKDFEGVAAAPAPKEGRGIIRQADDEGTYTDTDQNDKDFVLIAVEDPELEPEDPDDTEIPDPTDEAPLEPSVPIVYKDIEISELLPDPQSPQTDSDDEFVELYNPHNETIDLRGYVLVTGASWSSKYTLKDVSIAPYGYVALMSAQTSIALSNAGTGVKLLDPSGKLVFEVPNYGKAQPGASWVRDATGAWVWTSKTSPDTQNIVEQPAVVAKATKPPVAQKPAAAKSTSAKKASVPKTSVVKGATTPAAQPAQATTAKNENHMGMWVLGGALVLGLGYALFEYRHEIGGFMRRRWEAVAGLIGRK